MININGLLIDSRLLLTGQWTAIDQAVDCYRPSSGLLSAKQWTTIDQAVDYYQTGRPVQQVTDAPTLAKANYE